MSVRCRLGCQATDQFVNRAAETNGRCIRTRNELMRSKVVEPLNELVFVLVVDEREDVDWMTSGGEHKRHKLKQFVANIGGTETLVVSIGLGYFGERLVGRRLLGQVELDGAQEVGHELPVDDRFALLVQHNALMRRQRLQVDRPAADRKGASAFARIVSTLVVHKTVAVELGVHAASGCEVAPNELTELDIAHCLDWRRRVKEELVASGLGHSSVFPCRVRTTNTLRKAKTQLGEAVG